MYGEGDKLIAMMLQYAEDNNGSFIRMGNGENLEAYAYAGNVAWGFVCCLKTMYNNPSFGNERMFIMDDTPPQSIQALSRPYLESRGFKMTSYYVPLSIVFCICFLVETVCLLISPFKRFSFPLSLSGIIFSTRKFYVRYDKAKTLIGYVPPFSVEDFFIKPTLYEQVNYFSLGKRLFWLKFLRFFSFFFIKNTQSTLYMSVL